MPDPTGRISFIPEMLRGVSWKQPVRVASTANATISTAFANGQTVDGITLATGDRILLKDQTSGSANGIYTVNASGAPTRAFDMDQDGSTSVPAEESLGAMVVVLEGTTNGGTIWRCTNTGTVTLGTTALTFSQFAAGASFATPAIVLGTAAAAGAAVTVIRSDATIAAFTSAIPLVESGSGSAGTAAKVSREDHVHPAASPTAAAVRDAGRWEPVVDSDGTLVLDGGDVVMDWHVGV